MAALLNTMRQELDAALAETNSSTFNSAKLLNPALQIAWKQFNLDGYLDKAEEFEKVLTDLRAYYTQALLSIQYLFNTGNISAEAQKELEARMQVYQEGADNAYDVLVPVYNWRLYEEDLG